MVKERNKMKHPAACAQMIDSVDIWMLGADGSGWTNQTLALSRVSRLVVESLSIDDESGEGAEGGDGGVGVEGWRKAVEGRAGGAGQIPEAPSPPREPKDPEAIRRYCGRTSVSGRESSSLSYASSTATYFKPINKKINK